MAEHLCPIWIGYLLASPIRRLFQNPEHILKSHIKEGMTVIEPGPAMGFFSIPLAKMVGDSGKVVCVELQEKMFESLNKRARKAGVKDRIETRICTQESMGVEDLNGKSDFVLAFAMVHESSNVGVLINQFNDVLRPGGRALICEPAGHVSDEDFDETITLALKAGFVEIDRPVVRRSLSVLLEKPEP
jgi:ubiquinone/menaquinone biosynthesis C-methylase UbiE